MSICKMTVKLEIITPQKAKSYLKHNEKNRAVNNKIVDYYAKQMKEGKWDKTSSPITFFKNGILADGQHRLYAVIKSNVAIQAFVCYGAPFSGNYDNGYRRNIRDQIYLGSGVKFNTFSVRVANLALRTKGGSEKPTADQIEKWLTNNDEEIICKIAAWCNPVNKQEISMRHAAYILASYSFYKYYKTEESLEEIREVIKILKSGFMNDKKGSKAVIKFRNCIVNKFIAYGSEYTDGPKGRLFKLKMFQEVLKKYHENNSGGRKAILECPKDYIYPC